MANDRRHYYRTLFPAEPVWKLMVARNPQRPEVREFACELEVDDGEIWKRYGSCASPEDLRRIVVGSAFKALHVGPCFSEAARHARRPGAYAKSKELIFDLDLQDVPWFGVDKTDQAANDRFVRATFASCAVLVAILKEVMGFGQFLPVYSGRRGVHLWVLDERCFHWGDAERSALCSFVAGVASKKDPSVIMTQHIRTNPSFGRTVWDAVDRATNALVAPFAQGGVGLLDRPRDVERFVAKLFDVAVETKFQRAKDQALALAKSSVVGRTGADALDKLEEAAGSNVFWANRLSDVLLSLTWPVIDVGATAKTNHCTKSIFSLHAKTGRVAVPVKKLYASPDYALPPVVVPREISEPDTESFRRFAEGVALLEHAGANWWAPTTDIEDLVSQPVSKRMRA